ncbi:MAG: mechanosensitive ion channel family protein, partial [Deltaproteobacteria bacterium]|nr:mechanosensitive ion channel family protein [Deltaproteobacteria bacterium]
EGGAAVRWRRGRLHDGWQDLARDDARYSSQGSQVVSGSIVLPAGSVRGDLGVIWFAGLERIATFAGILGAGLAVALHDTIANIAGFLFIMLRRPFEVGDRIEIGGVAGDVIDIRLFQFSLLEIGNWVDADQSTGRILQVPNGQVLRSVTASFNKGFDYIWHEIPILITFESNWKKAKGILQDIVDDDRFVVAEEVERQVRRAASRYLIYSRRGTEQQLWEQILERFAENDDIELAYPTVRYYDQSQ